MVCSILHVAERLPLVELLIAADTYGRCMH
jgi:hypothetical protein